MRLPQQHQEQPEPEHEQKQRQAAEPPALAAAMSKTEGLVTSGRKSTLGPETQLLDAAGTRTGVDQARAAVTVQKHWRGAYIRQQYWAALETQAAALELELAQEPHDQQVQASEEYPVVQYLHQHQHQHQQPQPPLPLPPPRQQHPEPSAEPEPSPQLQLQLQPQPQPQLQPQPQPEPEPEPEPRPQPEPTTDVQLLTELGPGSSVHIHVSAKAGASGCRIPPKLHRHHEENRNPCTELLQAQRTYVQVATSARGIDGDGSKSGCDIYRALHAIYHPQSWPHELLPWLTSDLGPKSLRRIRYSIEFLQQVCTISSAEQAADYAVAAAGTIQGLLQANLSKRRNARGRGKGRGKNSGKGKGNGDYKGKGKFQHSQTHALGYGSAATRFSEPLPSVGALPASQNDNTVPGAAEEEEDAGPAVESLLSVGARSVAGWLAQHGDQKHSRAAGSQFCESTVDGPSAAALTLHISPAVIAHVVAECSTSTDNLSARVGYVAAGWIHGQRRQSDGTITKLSGVNCLCTVDHDNNLTSSRGASRAKAEGSTVEVAFEQSTEGLVGLVLVSIGGGVLPPSPPVLSKLLNLLGKARTTTGVHDMRKDDGEPIVILVLDLLHTVAAAERGTDGADCEAYSALLHSNLESGVHACTVDGSIDFHVEATS